MVTASRQVVKGTAARRFIYITGCDGTGKSTQARLLLAQLKASGIKARHLWLRYPFFLSLPLLAYARLRGYSWREKTGDMEYSYWDFHRSWLMRTIFPWALLLDAALAALWKVYLPLWRGETVVCERFILDMLVDQAVAFRDIELFGLSPWKLYIHLLPKHACLFILDTDAEVIVKRRDELQYDRRLHERIAAYRKLLTRFQYTRISSDLPIELVNQSISTRIGYTL